MLLWALRRAALQLRDRGDVMPRLVAAHLDHGLDAGSKDRAYGARRLAEQLGLSSRDLRFDRLPEAASRAARGVEDWARRRRYEFLVRIAEEESARVVVTAHHAADQAETVALRLLYGSGLNGLAGIRPRLSLSDRVELVRPFLAISKEEITEAVEVARGYLPHLTPLHDPTNLDAAQPRSRVRHHLLPRLESQDPGSVDVLQRVARAARRFGRRLDNRLDQDLKVRRESGSPFDFFLPPTCAVSLDAFLGLPNELRRYALALLHSRLGRPFPPPEAAVAELERQLDVYKVRDADVGVDCGGGLRWFVRPTPAPSLVLERRIPSQAFTYTFETPGATDVPEIFASLQCGPFEEKSSDSPPPSWMFHGEVLRTGLCLPAGARPVATVRSRRPGDRLRPLGASGSRRLKDVLIDRRVPRAVRDRIPLLFLDGILAWVPGVTVDERFRLERRQPVSQSRTERARRSQVWTAEIHRAARNENRYED